MQRLVVICSAILALAGANECPDGRRCEDGQTCCNDPATGYECCPFDQATCCEDHMHCCPAGTVCDAAKSSCVNATASVPWVLGGPSDRSTDQSRLSKSFRMIKTYVGEDGDNVCPDKSRCPPEFSCLKVLTRFGCCPLAQGTSCSDGKHCCPDGQRCSADSSSCIREELMATALCSDGASECPEVTTCCENPGGKWGCCPMPKAVCCEDKIHCCPDGSACDLKNARCISLSTKKEMPMWAKLPARIIAEWEQRKEGKEVTAGTVNGGGSEKAPEGNAANTVPPPATKISDAAAAAGAASIEPMGPEGKGLDATSDKGKSNEEIQCDAHSSCPQSATCCLGTSFQTWACCPLPKALCCADGIHCCPKGYQCSNDTCINGDVVIPWYTRLPATTSIQTSPAIVQCDGQHQCPDGNTCCKLVSGEWGCCPLPQALCCADGIHCCPKGYQCSKDTCTNGHVVIPWYTKLPATTSIQTSPAIVRCDGETHCSEHTTCCKLATGQWSCCPLPQALCCADGIHCCPKGYQCSEDTCINGDVVIPWYTRLPASPTIVQCDSQHQCPYGSTCCKLVSGEWACCPLPQALCCADGIHCCPKGYQCSKDTCTNGDVVIPWYTRLPATTSIQTSPTIVQCDDQHQCPYGNTCCKLVSGQWSCCALPNAVCCPDMQHCCPEGLTCDSASLSCQRLITLQVDAVPLKPVDLPELQNQVQEAWSEENGNCEEEETYCKISTTAWGCCPYPDAVCCSNMKHCCPTGYTCSEDGECIKNTSLQWLWHMFISSKNRALIL